MAAMLQPTGPGAHQREYRGRVRSGCLTCRARKVKCDETRPNCNNCTRLERHCAYKPLKTRQTVAAGAKDENYNKHDKRDREPEPRSPHIYPSPPGDQSGAVATPSEAPGIFSNGQDPFQYPDISTIEVATRLRKALQTQRDNVLSGNGAQMETGSHSALISRDIELTTTMDLLAARSNPLQLPSSIFFLDNVDCPAITPFDPVNWDMMKSHIAEMAKSCEPISEAITAVCSIYRGQLYAMCTSGSLSLYLSAKDAFRKLLDDRSQEFLAVLVAAFLLCLFELVYPGELTPTFKEPSKALLERLSDWAERASTHSELSIRLVTWLRIIHRLTLRGGGMGLISNEVYNLLPSYDGPLPDIKPPPSYHADVSSHLYQALSGPIFDFYYRLQLLSGEIAQLTHYHRSRITGNDQEEVVEHIASIKPRLRALWDSRCATHCQTPDDLRSQLGPSIANRIISLIGICDAAYHAELVEIDRVLGDPVSRWTDSRESIQVIRNIVDASWEQSQQGGAGAVIRKLNPGYLRPLFLYAIECMDQEENQWAVDRMAQIQNPTYRSDFFAAFGKALSDAQLRKERRVTSKYFCHWCFGVSPPFM